MRSCRYLAYALALIAFHLEPTTALRYPLDPRQDNKPSANPTQSSTPSSTAVTRASSTADPSQQPSDGSAKATAAASTSFQQTSKATGNDAKTSSVMVTSTTIIQAPSTSVPSTASASATYGKLSNSITWR